MEIVSQSNAHVFGAVGNVLITHYFETPDGASLHERVSWFERVSEEHGSFGLVVVIDEKNGGELPGSEFRTISQEQAQRFAGKWKFSAIVIESRSLKARVLRKVLDQLSQRMSRDVEVRFFKAVGDATAWAAEQARAHGGPAAVELQEASRQLRSMTASR